MIHPSSIFVSLVGNPNLVEVAPGCNSDPGQSSKIIPAVTPVCKSKSHLSKYDTSYEAEQENPCQADLKKQSLEYRFAFRICLPIYFNSILKYFLPSFVYAK